MQFARSATTWHNIKLVHPCSCDDDHTDRAGDKTMGRDGSDGWEIQVNGLGSR